MASSYNTHITSVMTEFIFTWWKHVSTSLRIVQRNHLTMKFIVELVTENKQFLSQNQSIYIYWLGHNYNNCKTWACHMMILYESMFLLVWTWPFVSANINFLNITMVPFWFMEFNHKWLNSKLTVDYMAYKQQCQQVNSMLLESKSVY